GGIEQVYPKENAALAEEIIETGGAVISEMAFGSMPRAKDFPRRNRLVSGMSRGVLVIEAALRSGSLITARYGLEQNRDIFAIPGSPMDPRAAGTNKLIKDGAKLVTGASDILEEFELGKNAPDLFLSEEGAETDLFSTDLLPADPSEFDIHSQGEASAGDHQTVLNSLSVTPVAIDDLIDATSLSAPIVQAILLELDLAGRIERSSGQLVALI
ncbi:Rossmann fold nucleotide-binding protein Smf possibly involved in DNA uptake, partial [hydrothermal vent metagenome]